VQLYIQRVKWEKWEAEQQKQSNTSLSDIQKCAWWFCTCLKSTTNFNWSAGFSLKASLVCLDS
ncbi:hypothetical protein, partial [Nostoc sp. JL23]